MIFKRLKTESEGYNITAVADLPRYFRQNLIDYDKENNKDWSFM